MFDPAKCLTSFSVSVTSGQVDADGKLGYVTCTHELDFGDALAGQRAMSEYFSVFLRENAESNSQRRSEQKAAMALWSAADSIRLDGYGEKWDGRALDKSEREAFLSVPAFAAHAVAVGNAASERLGGRVDVRPLAPSGSCFA